MYAVCLGDEDVAQYLLKEEKYEPHPELPIKSRNARLYLCVGEMLEKGE